MINQSMIGGSLFSFGSKLVRMPEHGRRTNSREDHPFMRTHKAYKSMGGQRSTVKMIRVVAPSPLVMSNKYCTMARRSIDASCHKPPPTLLVLTAGIGIIALLLTVVVLLLLCSHFRLRRARERLQGSEDNARGAPQENNENGDRHENGFLERAPCPPSRAVMMVILPGEDRPHSFAKPSPYLPHSPDLLQNPNYGGSDPASIQEKP